LMICKILQPSRHSRLQCNHWNHQKCQQLGVILPTLDILRDASSVLRTVLYQPWLRILSASTAATRSTS